jgi:hypothetical protein
MMKMLSPNLVAAVVMATDILVPLTILSVWLSLRRSRMSGPADWQIAIPLCLALGWGALWTWVPSVSALRLQPPPFGQAGAILALTLGLCLLLLSRLVRQFFGAARSLPLVALGPWRIVYGLALLLIGLSGGLPPAFFWSAASGDIAVGLWSVAILMRRSTVMQSEILAWNFVGLLDLMHVLILGALHLRGFYLTDPGLEPLNLLPIVGVPVFMALHVLTLWGFWARRGEAKAVSPA